MRYSQCLACCRSFPRDRHKRFCPSCAIVRAERRRLRFLAFAHVARLARAAYHRGERVGASWWGGSAA